MDQQDLHYFITECVPQQDLAGSQTFNDLAESVSFETASYINTDQQKGLDSWMS